MSGKKGMKQTLDGKANRAVTNLDPTITAKHRAFRNKNNKVIFGRPPRRRLVKAASRSFIDEDFDE